jgi:membrane-associated phospholipid phosphatase
LKIFRNNIYFFIPYLIILAFTSFFLVTYSRAEIHIYLNHFHNGFSDSFFNIITFLGSGYFVVFVCICLLIVSFRKALLFFATYLATGIDVQILKRTIFDHVVRPAMYFKDNYDLYFVEGVKIYNRYSFPSGHAATTFGFFVCLALVSKNNLVKISSLLLACLAAYSRVYLSQHFLADIYFGSLIGVAGGMVFYYVIFILAGAVPDKSLISLLTKDDKHKGT